MNSTSQIDIGEIIRQKLKEEGRTLVWLSKKVYCDSSNLTKLLSHSSIHTDLLVRISIALKTDFFMHFSEGIYNDIVCNDGLYGDMIYNDSIH
jgi:hypothetical protein